MTDTRTGGGVFVAKRMIRVRSAGWPHSYDRDVPYTDTPMDLVEGQVYGFVPVKQWTAIAPDETELVSKPVIDGHWTWIGKPDEWNGERALLCLQGLVLIGPDDVVIEPRQAANS